MFLAICAIKNLQIYGADVVDAYSHSPAEEETFIKVDDAYSEWYFNKFGKQINRNVVSPIKNSLQGIPHHLQSPNKEARILNYCP